MYGLSKVRVEVICWIFVKLFDNINFVSQQLIAKYGDLVRGRTVIVRGKIEPEYNN